MEFSVMDRTRPMSFERPNLQADHVSRVQRQRFKIRLAGTSHDLRKSAMVLVERMYGWRGYRLDSSSPPAETTGALTITALVYGHQGEPVGTATLRFDGPGGLLADELYAPELDALRTQGRRLVEYSKLAIDRGFADSRKVVASLMNVFYTYATAEGFTDAIIEVNPRHVDYYVSRANFERMGEERHCRRVNAPAVLLRLNYEVATRQIALYGGQKNNPAAGKSLYSYFLVGDDQDALATKLLGDSPPADETDDGP
jgi:hypothetical protein